MHFENEVTGDTCFEQKSDIFNIRESEYANVIYTMLQKSLVTKFIVKQQLSVTACMYVCIFYMNHAL